MSSPTPQRAPRTLSFLPLAIAALGAVLAAQTIGRDPRFVAPLLALAAVLLVPAFVGRMRMRRLLVSGDVERVIGTWVGTVDRLPNAGTMAPLLRATAYASYGWSAAARRALERAVKGPAWDAALEQRLFVETLLDTFEGDRDGAMRKAGELQSLPTPSAGFLARRRIRFLRDGLAALARAFAHASLDGDASLLARAARTSPLLHWAMRYARAVVAVDGGRARDVDALLRGSPEWPEESAFRAYHQELLLVAGPKAPGGGPT